MRSREKTDSQSSNPSANLSEIETFSGAALPGPGGLWGANANSTGKIVTLHNVNQTLVTDQAGKQRISQSDALGELTDVWEITTADTATESITFPNTSIAAGYHSTYLYDGLGDLIQVNQRIGTNGSNQQRTFVYDSLKRMSSMTNPEGGIVSYAYDGNRNLVTKTDARSIVTTMSYDPLNRVTSKTYSDGTPQLNYYYDNQNLPFNPTGFNRGYSIGRTVAVITGGTSSSAGNYYGYDHRGQIVQKMQVSGAVFPMSVAYNLAGGITSESYPSGRTVSYGYDGSGRMLSLNSPIITNAPVGVSLSNISYAPSGGLLSETYGNGLVHSIGYNSRQYAGGMTSGAPDMTFDQNNKVMGMTYDSVGNMTYDGNHSYSFDAENKVIGYDSFSNQYVYDGEGNRVWKQDVCHIYGIRNQLIEEYRPQTS